MKKITIWDIKVSRKSARNKESKQILSSNKYFGGEPKSTEFKDHGLSLCRGCQ